MIDNHDKTVTPEIARMVLRDQLAAVGYVWPSRHESPSSHESPDLDDLPLFDEAAFSAWPYYEAMLEVASTPGEVAWVGWQLIAYYLADAEQSWPDQGALLAHVVADSATTSPRLGSFLSQWLTFVLSDVCPAAAVLTVEILNCRHGWNLGSAMRRVQDSLPGGPASGAYLVPRSDLSAVTVRAAIVWCFNPELGIIPTSGRAARSRWAAASAEASLGTDGPLGEQQIVQAVQKLREPRLFADADCSAERVIVRLLERGVDEVARTPAILDVLAEVVAGMQLMQASVVWLALEELLRRPLQGDACSGRTSSAWQSLRSTGPDPAI